MKKRIAFGFALVFALLVTGLVLSEKSGKDSMAETTVGLIRQTDATETSVTVSWEGTAGQYLMYQYTSSGQEVGKLGVVTSPVTIDSLMPGSTNFFKIFECDPEGNKISEDDPGIMLQGMRTLPKQQAKPELTYWYRASDEADISWASDGQVDGYQIRVEKLNGKKLSSATITASSVSGQATVMKTIKPCYRGRVARVRVRGYINLNNGKKKYYGEWSEPLYYASAKEIKLSGGGDTIHVSGLKVKDASKKEVFVSPKKNKGFEMAALVKDKDTKCQFSEYGEHMISSGTSGRTYYIRVYYYFEVDGKEMKSPVYDEGSVYVKPAYFDIEVD
ncbi:MAG: hypothetical protein J5819_10740 [Eubacterium sp.]|nr:hypothetical protein [Eubacterium sp.]